MKKVWRGGCLERTACRFRRGAALTRRNPNPQPLPPRLESSTGSYMQCQRQVGEDRRDRFGRGGSSRGPSGKSINSMTRRFGDTRTRTLEPIRKPASSSQRPCTRRSGTVSGLPSGRRITVRRLRDAGLVGEGARAPDGEAVVESSIAMIILLLRVVVVRRLAVR